MPLMSPRRASATSFVQRLAQRLDRAGGVLISAGLERILTLQLQQRRNVDQHFGYLILVHA